MRQFTIDKTGKASAKAAEKILVRGEVSITFSSLLFREVLEVRRRQVSLHVPIVQALHPAVFAIPCDLPTIEPRVLFESLSMSTNVTSDETL